jgi:hypothetical protein
MGHSEKTAFYQQAKSCMAFLAQTVRECFLWGANGVAPQGLRPFLR